MATDSIRVRFSASIGELISGVQDAKKAIDSVRESTDRVTEGAKGLLEAFGVAFSFDKVVEGIAQLAEAGEKIERMSATLGAPPKDVQELGYIAKMTGGDTDSLALAMERFEVNLQKAQGASSQQALALHAIGLSAKELLGVPIPEQMNRVADAFARFADGPNKAAVAIDLFGRAGAAMIPILDEGRAGLQRCRDAADSGAVMSRQTVEALGTLNRATIGLGASLHGLAGTLVGEIAPSLTSFATGATTTANDLHALVEAGTLGQYFMETLAHSAEIAGLQLQKLGTIIVDVGALSFGRLSGDLDAINQQISAVAKTEMANQDAILDKAKASYKALIDEMQAGATKAQVPALNVGGAAALSDQIKALNEAIQTENQAFQSEVEQINAAAKTFRISEEQKTAALIAAVNARVAVVESEIQKEIDLYRNAGKDYSAKIAEMTKVAQKGAEDIRKFQDQAAEQTVKDWEAALAPLTQAWDSQLQKLLSGSETFGTAMKKITADIVIDMIKEFEKLAVYKPLLNMLSEQGGGISGPGTLLGALGGAGGSGLLGSSLSGLSKLFSANVGAGGAGGIDTNVNDAVVAAMTANTAAIGLQTVATGANTTAVTTAAAASGGGALGGIAGLFKTFTSFLPGFDVGSWSVPNDMVAQIHQGEVILPNNGLADAFRSGAFGGGSTSSSTVNINGAVGTQQWLNQVMQQFTRAQQAFKAINPSYA